MSSEPTDCRNNRQRLPQRRSPRTHTTATLRRQVLILALISRTTSKILFNNRTECLHRSTRAPHGLTGREYRPSSNVRGSCLMVVTLSIAKSSLNWVSSWRTLERLMSINHAYRGNIVRFAIVNNSILYPHTASQRVDSRCVHCDCTLDLHIKET